MDRKKFIKKGLTGIGAVIAIPSIISSKSTNEVKDQDDCEVSPYITDGPFPIKTPAELTRENIIGDRTGVALRINIRVENINNNCEPLKGALVDVWQCDAKGNYSEYSGQLDGNFTNQHFLRGRQTTDANGVASFISIYPGWYPGRAPHLHLEIKNSTGKSLLITQTAFPEDVSKTVYATDQYKGIYDTSNSRDFEFGDTIKQSMATSVLGNVTDGYTLTETIKVAG